MVLCDDLEGWEEGGREAQEGGGIADPCYCTEETKTTLQSNYPPIKKFFKCLWNNKNFFLYAQRTTTTTKNKNMISVRNGIGHIPFGWMLLSWGSETPTVIK